MLKKIKKIKKRYLATEHRLECIIVYDSVIGTQLKAEYGPQIRSSAVINTVYKVYSITQANEKSV